MTASRSSSGTYSVKHYMLLNGLGIDERFAQTSPEGTTSYLSDARGSTIGVTDASGSMVGSYSYEPYGGTSFTGSVTTPFEFTGRENDGATNLYYYRARYYSPELGRFVAEDPSGFAGGFDLYAYANGNPVSLRDPLGLWSFSFDVYTGFGGGLVLTGTGFTFTSITLKGGYGLGGGVSFNPWGRRPDPCAVSGANSMGVFAQGSVSIPGVEAGWGYNAGLNTWTDSDGLVHYSSYSGGDPEFGTGNGSGGFSFGGGIEAEYSVGGEWTKTF